MGSPPPTVVEKTDPPTPTPDAAPPPPVEPPPQAMPAECLAYRAAAEQMINCPALPAEARNAMRDGFDQAWKTMEQVPVEQRDALRDGCKSAVDAMNAALVSAKC